MVDRGAVNDWGARPRIVHDPVQRPSRYDSFDNAAQGININESSENVVHGTQVYGNNESGIDVGQSARDTVLDGNNVRANKEDGVRLVTAAEQSVASKNMVGIIPEWSASYQRGQRHPWRATTNCTTMPTRTS